MASAAAATAPIIAAYGNDAHSGQHEKNLAGRGTAAGERRRGRAEEAREDAWWTGPMLAASAATLPRGTCCSSPTCSTIISNGHFDSGGERHSGPYEHDLGSLTYMLYGLTDRVTAGLIPRFMYNEPAGAPNSSGIGIGDLTLQAGYGLTQYQDGHSIPAISLVLQETLPTGRYDRLGARQRRLRRRRLYHRARAVLAGLFLDAERTNPARAARSHLRPLLFGGACTTRASTARAEAFAGAPGPATGSPRTPRRNTA